MVINKFTLKRKSAYDVRSVMVCHLTGSIYFSKNAARMINAPCKLSFDFDEGYCKYDDNGFEIVVNENGFFLFSNKLVRFISEKFNTKKPKFEIDKTIDKTIFSLKLIS